VIPHVQAGIGGGPARLADPFEIGFEVADDPLLHVAVVRVHGQCRAVLLLEAHLRLSCGAHVSGLHRLILLQQIRVAMQLDVLLVRPGHGLEVVGCLRVPLLEVLPVPVEFVVVLVIVLLQVV